ncbi:MAG: phosphatidate cytidylyltransferase [Chloroflexi bacterium]|nr:phosphatidate cytidylyltransferase [Chloroflexota bacterium]
MFLQRALVSLTLGPLGLYLIYLGGWFYFIPIIIIVVLATAEYANLMHHLGWQTPLWLLLPPILLLLIDGQWPQYNLLGPALTLGMFLIMLHALWQYEKARTPLATADWLATMGGILILGWLGRYFLLLRGLDEHGQWAFLVIFTIWVADTFAYLIGSRYGNHKLVPRLSPKKSVEGYVAGIIFGTIGSVVVSFIFPDITLFLAILIGLIMTSTSLAGDLAFSLLKREAKVKDSGHLFPGHGGALDRLDALLWGVALAYYLVLAVS